MDRRGGRWTGLCTEYSPLAAGSIDGTDELAHDRGIIRAMNASYKPNKGVIGDPQCTVFISRLHPNTTQQTIQDAFSKFGEVKRLRLVKDIVTGFSKGYAFVEYFEQESAENAHSKGFKMILDNVEIFVDFELERTLKGWIPRRLGGGFSGKKESGQLRFGGRDRPFREPLRLNDMRDRNERPFSRQRPDFSRHERSRFRSHSERQDQQNRHHSHSDSSGKDSHRNSSDYLKSKRYRD